MSTPPIDPPAKGTVAARVSADVEAVLAKHGITTDEGKAALHALMSAWAASPAATPPPNLPLATAKARFRHFILQALTRRPDGITTETLIQDVFAPLGEEPPFMFDRRKELYVMAAEGLVRCVSWHTTQQWTLGPKAHDVLRPKDAAPDEARRLAYVKELETEVQNLRTLGQTTTRLYQTEMQKVKDLTRDLKEAREEAVRAVRDRRDNQATANDARAKQAVAEQRATAAEAARDRAFASMDKMAERNKIAWDTIETLKTQNAQLAKSWRQREGAATILGAREYVIRQSHGGGKSFARSTIYATEDAALSWMAQNDDTVNILCRLVPSGTPSVPLSLLNEVLAFLRSEAPIGLPAAGHLAEKVEAALETAIRAEQAPA